MRGIELSRDNDKYRINEILGNKFQDFVNRLKSDGYNSFTVKNYQDMMGKNSIYENDLHYNFINYLIAVLIAFKQIETPDAEKTKYGNKYADDIRNAFNEMLNATPETSTIFAFNQLPYKHNNSKIKYLSHGFHLMSSSAKTYNFDNNKVSYLTAAIKYLYHFIAILDLSTINDKDVLTLLRGDGQFVKYVNQIASMLSTSNFYKIIDFPTGADEAIKQGINSAFAKISEKIIDDFKEVDKNFRSKINLEGKNLETIKNNLRASPIITTQISSIDWKTFYDIGPEAINVVPDENKRNNYVIDASLNPYYIICGKKELEENFYNNMYQLGGFTLTDELTLGNLLRRYDTGSLTPAEKQSLVKLLYNKQQIHKLMPTVMMAAERNAIVRENAAYAKLISEGFNPTASTPPTTPPKKPLPTPSTPPKKPLPTPPTPPPRTIFPEPPITPPTSSTIDRSCEFVSLPYLYGPKYTGNQSAKIGKIFLVTEPTQGSSNNSALANLTAITNLGYADNSGIIKDIIGNNDDSPFAKILYLAEIDFNIKSAANGNLTNDSARLKHVKEALLGYEQIAVRLASIPKTFNNFADIFATGFTIGSYRLFDINGTNVSIRNEILNVAKVNTLATPEIKSFFFKVILKNPRFYSTYFNLIRKEATSVSSRQGFSVDVPFEEIMGLENNDEELKKYRLNVKIIKGSSLLNSIQTGGNGTRIGDIIFISELPQLQLNVTTGIMVSPTDRISREEIERNGGPDFIRNLARKIYYLPLTSDNIEIIPGHNVDLKTIIPMVAQAPLFTGDYHDFFKRIIKNALHIGPSDISAWRDDESKLSEHMLRQASSWVRDGDDFIQLDNEGKEIKSIPTDNCQFFNESVEECFSFFQGCLGSTAEGFPEACEKILDFKFDQLGAFKINPAINILRDKVQKINPGAAFGILQRFGFGYYLDEEKKMPIPNFRRYKVQSVGSWLQELIAGVKKCRDIPAVDPCKPKTVAEILGENVAKKIVLMSADSSKHSFFDYLNILVQWVNANPQVLNPEELKNPKLGNNYPKPNNEYNLYDYRNPYRPAEYRVRSLNCGLERLKDSIFNEISGSQGASMISTIANIPIGLQMPLSRPGFVSPSPLGTDLLMFGGSGMYDVESELSKANQTYGYKIFQDIYNELVSTMTNMEKNNRIKLTPKSTAEINDKFERFRQTEEELRKSLASMIKRNELYRASHGYVNPYVDIISKDMLSDNKLQGLLSKHSNLLKLSSTYNKKASNLIDILLTISKAILTKVDDSKQNTLGSLERPMIADYHTAPIEFYKRW